eukprot:255528-Chlamydomonas_euryale.AAC.1
MLVREAEPSSSLCGYGYRAWADTGIQPVRVSSLDGYGYHGDEWGPWGCGRVRVSRGWVGAVGMWVK